MESLPTELFSQIAFWVRELDVDYSQSTTPRNDWTHSRSLWSLSKTNRAFAGVCKPLIYEFLELHAEQRLQRELFVEEIGPRYGHLVRAFQCTYSPPGGRVSALDSPIQRSHVRTAWTEICAVAPYLKNLRTLFTEYGKGLMVPVAKEMDLIATLNRAGLLAKVTTLDLRAPARRGLLNVERTSAIISFFPALEDLSITHFTRTSMTMDTLYAAPSHQPVMDALQKLPHLRSLSLQGLVLPSNTTFPSHLPPLQHLDLIHSFISIPAAVALTTLVRNSLKTLRLGAWDLDPPSSSSSPTQTSFGHLDDSKSIPSFNLPQLTSLTLRLNAWVPILRAFASSPLREVDLRSIGPLQPNEPSSVEMKEVFNIFKTTLKKVSGFGLEEVRDWRAEVHGIDIELRQ
ncbi:hypothetical protein BCR35DRAFT_304009 [Leucosporidium creatinivorum]|uniref:F-box domain-containing protein n=1 Tax=Leucosporidium creatinivorum TaxID=106004 RepID=A0A1Y2FEV6_9BASI|nr:hypothetical protein BCR35DRAFT_304009 [Leucosporidium creatinivorum]